MLSFLYDGAGPQESAEDSASAHVGDIVALAPVVSDALDDHQEHLAEDRRRGPTSVTQKLQVKLGVAKSIARNA